MAYFDQDFINELLAKADIENVVSDYVSLQNKSGRLWGLCPFHSEKTPSFSVTKDKQIFYCFGCHEGGNAIGFLMKIDKLTFPEAVEHLAERINMPLPKQTNNADFEKNKQRRKKIYEINKKAGLYYYENLKSAKGKKALDYLNNRGLDDRTITKFGLGYASETWDGLLNYLLKASYNQQDIKDAGLCSIKNNKAFDSFRNRVIFPIFNVFGDVIGFGGRVMDDSMPKYLNTSDTFAFNKRKNVYALNFVKAIKKLQSIVLVEGYMDVISLYAKGIYNAAATLGTALTKEQAQLIKRYVSLVYIAYDGDNAGQKAALKAVDIIEQVGLQAKVIKFSEGLDPDDFIKTFGYNAFVNQAKNASDAMSFRLDKLKENYNLDEAQSKAKYVVEGTNLLKKLSNPIEREQYILRLSKETGHSTQAIKDQLTAVSGNKVKTSTRYGVVKKTPQTNTHDKLEKSALKYFIAYPKKLSFYDMDKFLPFFRDVSIKAIISLINLKIKEGILPTNAELLTDLDENAKQLAGEVMTTLDEKEVQRINIAQIIETFEIRALQIEINALNKSIVKGKTDDIKLAKIANLNKELDERKKKPK